HPDDVAAAADELTPVFDGTEPGPVVVEVRVRPRTDPDDDAAGGHDPDDRARDWRWVEVTCSNAMDDPVIGGIVSSVRDVHERKRMEDALRASEEQLLAV